MYVFPGGFQLARGVGGSTFATAAPFECYPELKLGILAHGPPRELSSSTSPPSGPSGKTISRIASTMPWRPITHTLGRRLRGGFAERIDCIHG
jgi:hypothetical protein